MACITYVTTYQFGRHNVILQNEFLVSRKHSNTNFHALVWSSMLTALLCTVSACQEIVSFMKSHLLPHHRAASMSCKVKKCCRITNPQEWKRLGIPQAVSKRLAAVTLVPIADIVQWCITFNALGCSALRRLCCSVAIGVWFMICSCCFMRILVSFQLVNLQNSYLDNS